MQNSGLRRKRLFIHVLAALVPATVASNTWAVEEADPAEAPAAIEEETPPIEDAEAQREAPESDEAYELRRISVTGSRLRRTDWEGSLPVTTITREMIENSGETSTADLLRNLSFNVAGSFRPQSGSSAQGVSELNLRAIGANRTLVLVDGKRLPKSPYTGNTQDLNIIPLAAIERIEILSDGASAIYGSDAIGGVVNIITRSDYSGYDIKVGYGQPETPLEDGGTRKEAALTYGYTSDRTNLTAGLHFNETEIIYSRENPWNTPGASVFGNSFTSVFPDGFQPFNWTSYGDPGSCDFPGTGFYTFPNSQSFNGTRCAYDFTLVAADEASSQTTAIFANINHELNGRWGVYGNVLYSESESFGRYAPTPDSSHPAVGLGLPVPPDSLNNPTNPSSPLHDPAFGPPAPVHWWHRFDAMGNRDNTYVSEWTQLALGMQGQVGRFNLDFGVRSSNSRSRVDGINYLNRVEAALAIASGDYELGRPYDNAPEVLERLRESIWRNGKFDQFEYYATAAVDLFELPVGTVQFVFGTEYRDTSYEDEYDPLSEAGFIGGSSGNSAGAKRDVTSYFFETLVPVFDKLELMLAGRVDNYSDFSGDISPKLSLRWQVFDNLVLRASAGRGFRAPGSNILSQKDAESADTVRDEATCLSQGQVPTCQVQVPATVTGNPDLAAENSEHLSAGIVYAPADWLNLTLDYYSLEITDQIRGFSAQELIFREQEGLFIPPGLGVTRFPGTNAIQKIVRGFGNEGTIQNSGFDLNAVFDFEMGPGRLQSIVQYSRIINWSIDNGVNFVKFPGVPSGRGSVSSVYEMENWRFGWNAHYIGSQYDFARSTRVPTWITHDVQVTWIAPWGGRFVVGAHNVADKDPPLLVGNFGNRDYDFGLYDGYGRVPYMRYMQSFD
ncbi:MAG: TonB-dependent receptor [Xanthomonadales bacterium]|nr:TonB-dependent receptor [Xanthomonadales bacterium]